MKAQKVDNIRQMKNEQLINNLGDNVPLQNYNQAQKINVSEWISRYGKDAHALMGNTRQGRIIARLPQHNFGSMTEYNIDTLPNSYLSRMGIEKFELTQDRKTYCGKDIISRRYLSNVLSTWGYIVNIPYTYSIKMWCQDIPIRLDNKKIKPTSMLSGVECVNMIKDMLFLIRNKKINKILSRARQPIISPPLYNVIRGINCDRALSTKKQHKKIMDMKDRLYINHQAVDIAWAYPKYSVEYLIEQIKQLQSGQYFNELYVPIIHQLKKYPIKCKDTHLKPLTPNQHNKAKDDYDISQYYTDGY